MPRRFKSPTRPGSSSTISDASNGRRGADMSDCRHFSIFDLQFSICNSLVMTRPHLPPLTQGGRKRAPCGLRRFLAVAALCIVYAGSNTSFAATIVLKDAVDVSTAVVSLG